MFRIFGGAILLVAGIAAFIEAHRHIPVPATTLSASPARALRDEQLGITPQPASGLSPAAYDLLHIGAYALVIFGALLILVGLISHWGAARNA